MATRKRWTCECGNNVLAPGRMRKDDVRRFCLPCSERTGRLVARTCPSLEAVRGRKEAARREKRAASVAVAREKKAPLRRAKAARRRVARLRAWEREGLRMRPEWIALRRKSVPFAYGRAGRTGFVVFGDDAPLVWLEVVLVHEFTHVCLVRTLNRGRVGHGQAFRGLFLTAACEYFGIDEREVLEEWGKWKGYGGIKAYDLDIAVAAVVGRTRSGEDGLEGVLEAFRANPRGEVEDNSTGSGDDA